MDGLRPPRAPRELRQQTLRALALETRRASPSEWLGHLLDELALSRTFRIAWLAAILLLCSAHLGLNRRPPGSDTGRPKARVSAPSPAEEIDLSSWERRYSSSPGYGWFTHGEALETLREEI